MSIENVLAYISNNSIKFVDFRFTDIGGLWHHMTFSASFVDEKLLEEGIYFDGSSIVGWRAIHESDMLMKPDLSCLVMDPFSAQDTLILNCSVYDPQTNLPYNRDPRSIAKRAEEYLAKSGIATKAFFGPEAEFFIFDGVRFDVGTSRSFYEIVADEFNVVNGHEIDENSHGHRPHSKLAYFPVTPLDSLHDIRSEMCTIMSDMGLSLERHHHEVAPAQHEIGFKFSTLVDTADNLQIYKYVVKNVAHGYGKTATFMPKPIFGDNGSGMHVHQSLWQDDTPLFAGDEYNGLSQDALYYIGGILKHAKVLNAFTNPTTNSYKRLVPGYEAPVILAYSCQNRSAACRIPLSHGANSKRIEIRFPDPLANPYLAFSAMLMAGLDGIKNKIHPGDPAEQNLFEDTQAASKHPTVASSLREALTCLEKDYDFLLEGDVFCKDFLESYTTMKWEEVYEYELSPHPIEFKKYYAL